MGIHKASPLLWKKETDNPLQVGDTYGVDVRCILYTILSTQDIHRNLFRDPLASVKDLTTTWLDNWYRVHRFHRLNTKFVFVFDGHELGLKVRRRQLRRDHVRLWQAAAAAAKTWQEYDKAMSKLARVNGHLIRDFCDWVRSKLPSTQYCLFGAPFETDAQLVYFEWIGLTDGTLSCDSDIFFYVFFYEVSENVFSGFNTRSTRKYRSIIKRQTVDPYFSSLRGEALRTLGCFMGTDYIQHLQGIG